MAAQQGQQFLGSSLRTFLPLLLPRTVAHKPWLISTALRAGQSQDLACCPYGISLLIPVRGVKLLK